MSMADAVKALYRRICEADYKEMVEQNSGYAHRDYLGASSLGGPCERELFFKFRKVTFDADEVDIIKGGEKARLFDRGHKEEERIVIRLRKQLQIVYDVNPATGGQWEVTNCEGIFKGHLDGIAYSDGTNFPQGWYLLEFKTHNADSFDGVAGTKSKSTGLRAWLKNLKKSKVEHYSQMQAYLGHELLVDGVKISLRGGIYIAVNKNTDEWYMEYVEPTQSDFVDLMQTTSRVIWNHGIPDRMQYASKIKNFYCRSFCDFGPVCWGDVKPHESCRTCAYYRYSVGDKYCAKHDKILEVKDLGGCESFQHLHIV